MEASSFPLHDMPHATRTEGGDWDHNQHIDTPYTFSDAKVYQDMTAPLSHYFVSSGHNSYLTSDQLVGDSGTSTIIMVGHAMTDVTACVHASKTHRPPSGNSAWSGGAA